MGTATRVNTKRCSPHCVPAQSQHRHLFTFFLTTASWGNLAQQVQTPAASLLTSCCCWKQRCPCWLLSSLLMEALWVLFGRDRLVYLWWNLVARLLVPWIDARFFPPPPQNYCSGERMWPYTWHLHRDSCIITKCFLSLFGAHQLACYNCMKVTWQHY